MTDKKLIKNVVSSIEKEMQKEDQVVLLQYLRHFGKTFKDLTRSIEAKKNRWKSRSRIDQVLS